MKYIVILVAILSTTTAQASFFDDIFGAQTEQISLGKQQKHLNTYSTGHHNASWYNDRSGRTASGMRATYGVAHRTLPFGTRVLITNPANGRSVNAVVTDRGPFIKGRSLDVNQNVAHALGFSGTAQLKMELLQ